MVQIIRLSTGIIILILFCKSVRLKFFKRSAEKFISRTDPESEAIRDFRVIPACRQAGSPGLAPEFGSRG